WSNFLLRVSQSCPLGLQIPFCSAYLTFAPYNGIGRSWSSEKVDVVC
ncbi:hypothetical protein LINPERHAP1_LOCUS6329, partial [Linum perenne]